MALIKIPKEMGSTPGIVDNSNATAITIGSDESATFSGPIQLTAGALAAAGNAGLSHRSTDNKVYLQAGTGGFNILDDQQNTHFAIDSAGVSTFNNNVGIGTGTLTLPQDFTVLGNYENAGFYRDYSSAGLAANYVNIGRKDTNGALVSGVRISGGGDDGVEASHNGYFEIAARKAGVFVSLLSSYNAANDLVVNEAGIDMDFRVESDNSTHALFVEGSSGNVGIGFSAPDKKLNINTGAAADGIRYEVSYSPVNSLPRGTMTWDDANSSGAVTGQIDTRYDGTTVDMHFGSLYSSGYNATTRLIIKGNGNVEIPDGNLSFAAGHGIDFSLTANAAGTSNAMGGELLDDYEQGTWYPYLGTEAQLGGAASGSHNNKYVKIGRLVHCTGWFNSWNYANVTTGTYMMIRNLPFPPEMHSTGMRLSYVSNMGSSTYGYGHTALSAFYLLVGGSNGSPTHYVRSGAPTSGTGYSMLNIVYYTAS